MPEATTPPKSESQCIEPGCSRPTPGINWKRCEKCEEQASLDAYHDARDRALNRI
jgi:hypothetical protein